jgi:hypothetical protein
MGHARPEMIVLPHRPMTHEEMGVAMARTLYLEGRVDVEEFEARVERALFGDVSDWFR